MRVQVWESRNSHVVVVALPGPEVWRRDGYRSPPTTALVPILVRKIQFHAWVCIIYAWWLHRSLTRTMDFQGNDLLMRYK